MTGWTHAYLRVADHLRQDINEGRLAPGDKLPPQRELTERFGVSDIIIRRALDILRNEGLVESRQGSGTRVRARPPARRISMNR
ncbi:winged helix-turn-helix domain-containing protein [Streptosporangium sp. NPDC000396]|uniref:winged helix-turn-helix domain-containing protein n=1 Tax=Streptosporangium sp. NPDC000396 TaxID=3366185 RepID=UPI003688DA8D